MRIIDVIKKPLASARNLRDDSLKGVSYWERRAERLGPRAVFNASHPPEDLAAVTGMQKRILFPWFCAALTGREHHVLDFGCGTGRFTVDLASLVDGVATGIDPIAALLARAPTHEDVTYKLGEPGKVALPTDSVDVVWVCLVLGGIAERNILFDTVRELERVLRPGGLLFLVENTSDHSPGDSHWMFRSVSDYTRLFGGISLTAVGEYSDLGERISALAGRARP
jgi:ubiquinone/menaquinone biosynthesis C-methylase UbiE